MCVSRMQCVFKRICFKIHILLPQSIAYFEIHLKCVGHMSANIISVDQILNIFLTHFTLSQGYDSPKACIEDAVDV